LPIVLGALLAWRSGVHAGPKLSRADFEPAVAAILVKNCVPCHNASELKGGLDLTRQQGLLKGGKSGPAVVPGKPHQSYLIERVTEGSMPPKRAGQRLSTADVESLRAWVAAGA